MATVTLTFPNPLNTSLQVGDTAYYSAVTQPSGAISPTYGQWNTSTQASIVEIGEVTSIVQATNTVVCDTDLLTSNIPTTSHYIFFSKDNKANLSSILGYYAEVKLSNNSTTESELHSVASDIFESSK